MLCRYSAEGWVLGGEWWVAAKAWWVPLSAPAGWLAGWHPGSGTMLTWARLSLSLSLSLWAGYR